MKMANIKGFSAVAVLFLVLAPNLSSSQLQRTGIRDSLALLNRSTLVVSTLLINPYCIQNENGEFEGFVPDLLQALEEHVGASFKIQKTADGRHGYFDTRTNSWTGVVKDLIDGKADIGLTDLVVTAERESVIDFTVPFMEMDVTILYRADLKEPIAFGWLLSAVSWPMWFSLIGSYIAVSVVLFVIGRISPYQSKVKNENELSISNSFWVNASSLLLRTTDVRIVAMSTRLLVSAWWLFSLGVFLILIVLEVSMFTSGAAFAPVEPNFFTPTGSVSLGVIKGGSSLRLLQSRPDLIQLLRRVESSGDKGILPSGAEGIIKVLNGDLDGFVMESSLAEIVTAKHCNLKTIAESLDRRSYAVAVQEDSPLRDILSVGLLKLRENGRLAALKSRWWPRNDCSDFNDEYLSPANVGTYYMLFVVLFMAMIIALLVAIVERFIYRQEVVEKKLQKNILSGVTMEATS